MRIEGSLVVVTGASAGIGAATARALGAAGAHVILVARRSDAVEAVADAIRSAGGTASTYAADLGEADQVATFAKHVLTTIGVPDAIINNAGAGQFLFIEETSPEQAVQMMKVPYFATFFTTRAFIEPMMARGSGTVLMVNTPVATMPWPGAVGYASARFAVRGFTEALRQDLRGTGVRVSSVTPTKVMSEYFDRNPGSEERIPKAEVLVGSTTPERVADVIVRTLRRNKADVHTPWRWRALEPVARTFPRPIALLNAKTGARRQKELTT